MKKLYLFFTALIAVSFITIKAQTDVTAIHLTNPNFDTDPICYTVLGGATLNTSAVRIGTLGWIFEIPGWTNESNVPSNAVQVASGEYGTVANANGFNNVPTPTTDKAGGTTGSCISMSAGWGDKANYSQNVTLPAGRYALKLDIINQHTNTSSVANYCGFIPATGTAIYSKKLSFPSLTWVSDSISFYLTSETAGKINLGMTTSSGGSANGAKLFIDNVKLIYYGVDKSGLKALIDSATIMKNNPQEVASSTIYTELATAITNAETVYAKVSATALEVVAQETALSEVISNVHGSILLLSRINTWKTFPYDATIAITNPSFESGFTGWTNVGPFQTQNNTSFDPKKTGTFYAEKWVDSGTALPSLSLSQTIKNIPDGVYLLTASAQAIQQTGPEYPGGAYIYADATPAEVFAINDYSVTVTVSGNTLEIGYDVNTTANWVAVDNFRLSYISDGSPYLILTPTALAFNPTVTEKVLNIKAGNLTDDITLTSTSSFTLSSATIKASDMGEEGVDVTINFIGSGDISNDSLIITSGSMREKVSITALSSATASSKGLFFDQSLPVSLDFTVSGNLFTDLHLIAPTGISLSQETVNVADALAGKTITATWDNLTRIEDKYIYLTSGTKKDSIVMFAVNDNLISTWDGDSAEEAPSKLTDFGWDQTLADGVTLGAASFQEYNTGGVRYVPATNAAHTYRGKAWIGHRVAYLRTWGSPATNVYNLAVNLEADETYVFRGVSGWHNNETNPTFTYAVNTAKSNLGDTLGLQSIACTVKQRGEDYHFEFTANTTATHYLTVSSSAVNDAMCGVDYLAIYKKTEDVSATKAVKTTTINVYPTITNNQIYVDFGGKTGSMKVFDISGRLVSSKNFCSDIETVNLPSSGIYFVEVKSALSTQTVKVIKVK